jgi:hypothetical protein
MDEPRSEAACPTPQCHSRPAQSHPTRCSRKSPIHRIQDSKLQYGSVELVFSSLGMLVRVIASELRLATCSHAEVEASMIYIVSKPGIPKNMAAGEHYTLPYVHT